VPRADLLLVEAGFAPSRTAAQRLIAAGRVRCAGDPVAKPAQDLPSDAELTVEADPDDRYVSRGGMKLAGALAASGVTAAGRVCLDVGQSTGGFTDCLLQAGAAKVVGVDVGHGQLHPRLKDDGRAVCIEGVNCRALASADLGSHLPKTGFDLIAADVSFISLTLVLPRLPALLATGGDLLLLVKPQFEVGPQGLGKGGIVRDPALYGEVEAKLRQAAADAGLGVHGWYDSPITGGDGNREFFIWLKQ
jgi:23S rRNA (cytidine1920-2'-O)/16S rRNA (cytidine1409-2'-O)-methyltransferase